MTCRSMFYCTLSKWLWCFLFICYYYFYFISFFIHFTFDSLFSLSIGKFQPAHTHNYIRFITTVNPMYSHLPTRNFSLCMPIFFFRFQWKLCVCERIAILTHYGSLWKVKNNKKRFNTFKIIDAFTNIYIFLLNSKRVFIYWFYEFLFQYGN